MSEWRLRDHTQPCEHIQNRKPEIWGQSSGSPIVLWHCSHPRCPGGREIELFALRLHSFDGGLWQFHAVDDPSEDGAPTHYAYALDVKVDGDE